MINHPGLPGMEGFPGSQDFITKTKTSAAAQLCSVVSNSW